MTKESFTEILRAIQRQQCAYMIGDKYYGCDCKFHKAGDRISTPKGSENSNGCPELAWCVSLINSLTEKQFANFASTGTLKPQRKVRVKRPAIKMPF